MLINFELTRDMKVIDSVMLNPVLWKLSVGTEEDPPSKYIGLPGLTYVSCFCDSKFVGLINYNFIAVRVMQIHPHILPEFWGKISQAVVAKFISNLRNQQVVTKLVAMIPKCCRHTRMFAARNKFKREGKLSRAVMYNDKVQDLIIYSHELRRL